MRDLWPAPGARSRVLLVVRQVPQGRVRTLRRNDRPAGVAVLCELRELIGRLTPAGNWEPGTGNRELGTGNWEPGTGNWARCWMLAARAGCWLPRYQRQLGAPVPGSRFPVVPSS